MLMFSIPVSALTFEQCDVNHDGDINVLDLIRAKKHPDDYDKAFRDELTDILLGTREPQENGSGNEGGGSGSQGGSGGQSGGGGAIYLPEIP